MVLLRAKIYSELIMRKKFLFISLLTGIFAVITFAASCGASMFNPSKKVLRNYLKEHSLVVIKNGHTNFYEGRGIKPLINYLKNNTFENAYVADKKIGKASALLIVYGHAQKVYTPLISKPAIKVFEDNNVKYSADEVVENIKNSTGTDLCPMEKKVLNIDDPEKAYNLFSSILK